MNSSVYKKCSGISLVVQWLRLSAPDGDCSVPGQETGSCMLQLKKKKEKMLNTVTKITHAATKTWHSQIKRRGGT